MTALITGANRGVGAALFAGLIARGDQVIGTARNATAPLLPLDVTKTDSHQALGDTLLGQPIDLLICNSGVLLDRDDTLETGYDAAKWAETFAVNVTGVFQTIQALLPNLRLGTNAKIAIISSQLASDTIASGGRLIYCASKAASLNLGRNLAVDLAPEGISVGIYHPGWVQTDMGGSDAHITAEASASGLIQRFDALSLSTTGCFETWDGHEHPF